MTRIKELLRKNIKERRKTLGYSQMDLAEHCGVSTSYIGEIEIGRKFPSADTLQKISDALGLRPSQLFFEDDDWKVFKKYTLLTDLSMELQEKITEDVKETVKKYINKDIS